MTNSEDEHRDRQLREFLLILLSDLSYQDRCKLHFAFGNAVPRRLRERCEIEYTLQIFEHLIERQTIFENLSEALRMCGRLDWSKRLSEFEQFLKSSSDIDLLEAILNDTDDD